MKKVNVLSKNEMKNVLGGNVEPGNCKANCKDGGAVECSGSCSAVDFTETADGYCTGTTNRQCSTSSSNLD